MRPRRAAWAAALLLVAGGAVACSGGGASGASATTTQATPAPEVTTTLAPRPTSTTLPLPTIPGTPRSTTTLATGLGSGRARISGTVVGPRGPVAGATVRIRRSVGSSVVGTDLVTNAAGTFVLDGVQGGRYVARAWKPPDLAQMAAEGFFLGVDESRTLQLRVDAVATVSVRSTTDADPLPVDAIVNLTVLVFAGTVDAGGELLASPLPGTSVRLVPGPRVATVGGDRSVADGNGEATFRIRCNSAGDTAGELVVGDTTRFSLSLPPCR